MVDGYTCPAPPDASKVTFEMNRTTWKFGEKVVRKKKINWQVSPKQANPITSCVSVFIVSTPWQTVSGPSYSNTIFMSASTLM